MIDTSELYCYYEEDPCKEEMHTKRLKEHVVSRAFTLLKQALENKGRKVSINKVDQHASLIICKDESREFEYDVDLSAEHSSLDGAHVAYSYNNPQTHVPIYAEEDIALELDKRDTDDAVDHFLKNIIRKYR